MARYSAVGRKLQIGEETTYGTLATMDTNLYYDSESITLKPNKTEEDNLLASTTASDFTLVGFDVSGDISLKLKPENLSILKYAFKEDNDPEVIVADTVYKHTLTLYDPGDEQKSLSATIDRGPRVVAYTGLVADSLSLEGNVREPISVKMTLKGKGEELDGTINDALPIPSNDTFTSIDGIVTIKGSTVNDVTKASISIANGLDDGGPTYGSGQYNDKPLHSKKTVTPSIDAFYNEVTAPIEIADLKGNTYISETITWISPKEISTGYNYKLAITMPKVSISEANSPNSGKETKKITLGGVATSNGGSIPITVEVWDGISTKY